MVKIIFTFIIICFGLAAAAQPVTREELEKQKSQLRRELEQTERMLNAQK